MAPALAPPPPKQAKQARPGAGGLSFLPLPKATAGGLQLPASVGGVKARADEDDVPNGLVVYGDSDDEGQRAAGAGLDIAVPGSAGGTGGKAGDVSVEYDEFGDPIVPKEKKEKKKKNNKKHRARKPEIGASAEGADLPCPKRPRTDA